MNPKIWARAIVLGLLPPSLRYALKRRQIRREKMRLRRFPPISEDEFRKFLRRELGVRPGRVVFVHSSTDLLNLAFPAWRILDVLRDEVGDRGTLVFPTFPKLSSAEFLQRGEIFDIRCTPSYTGLLSELARRQTGARRSLHPTKSVVASGPAAEQLVSRHHISPYPFDQNSPFGQLVELNGLVLGLGVSSKNMSFLHAVDDALKERLPVRVYLNGLFEGRCINCKGEEIRVKTYAHDLAQMKIDPPGFLRRHVPNHIAVDIEFQAMSFFRAEARPLFDLLVNLAERGITIYTA